ncbi:MAG: zinc ribbon domain-containing protein [Actinobacteria bacterium]|nr:zinc ribbon domain-containing protein [Actinomycetota bacterium]MCG2796452.1 zinc ribbon domain-containing protein [Actinomycetes bacterium]
MSEGANEEPGTCPECGAAVEKNAKFCTGCAEPLSDEAKALALEKKADAAGVQLWAYKAGERVKRTSWWVKLGIPIAIIVIVGIVVALFVVAAGHNPQATVDRYLSHLKVGDWNDAYELLVHPGGKFSTFDYFQRWQDVQVDNLGRMEDYGVTPRKAENRLFGRLIAEEPINGDPFVANLKFKTESFNVNITAEDAGGTWPFKKYRLRLCEGPTRAYVTPVGAVVSIDGEPVGKTVPDKELEEALSLGDLPDDLDGAVEYARKLLRTAEYAIEEFKDLASGLDKVAQDAQGIFDQAGTSGISWGEVMDSVDQLVNQSKDFGTDVARAAMHLYWVFGGGDDGSIRADLTRAETGLELNNLPEGYHVIEVEMPGMKTEFKEFHSPESVEITLEPNGKMKKAFVDTINVYYSVISKAMLSGDTSDLSMVLAGEFLGEETARVEDLGSRGLTVAAGLNKVEFEEVKVLAGNAATVETKETWAYTTYQGPVPISVNKNVKQDVTYTMLKGDDGEWKIIERKAD